MSTTMASSNLSWSRRRFLASALGSVAVLPWTARAIAESVLEQPKTSPVRVGLDQLMRDHLGTLQGQRIGLLCNHTAVDIDGVHAIDRLRETPGVDLVALFAPEHGLRGRVIAGKIASGTDEATGLPVWSLHGEHRKPTPEMLADLDLILIDLQDVGARFYTYSSTLALTMQAAGAADIPVWVLDRPNPIGGLGVHGPLLDPACASFLGMYPVPVRHGLTLGEFAGLVHRAYGVACDLQVIPMEHWQRTMYWPETGLPWTPPSPSLWRPEATMTYPGTCFFEGTNCSLGGSFFHPYEVVAAPWIDGEALAVALSAQGWPGVAFEPIAYTPTKPNDGKYADEECRGVWLQVTNRQRFDPIQSACAVLREVQRTYPEKITYRRSHMKLLAGSSTFLDTVLEAPALRPLVDGWNRECTEFDALRQPYLLYPQ